MASRNIQGYPEILGGFYVAPIFSRRHNIRDDSDAPLHDKEEELERNHSFLLVAATLATAVTYIAGLCPPGGFWPDNKGSHIAGDPVLQD